MSLHINIYYMRLLLLMLNVQPQSAPLASSAGAWAVGRGREGAFLNLNAQQCSVQL